MSGKQRQTVFAFLAQPTDVNFGGKVHGGMVMKWIDQAGYAGAVAWSGAYCVTVSVGGIQFVKPILIGDLVTVRCTLARTGTSSMHFVVDVLAQDLKSGNQRLATSCVIAFVALDAPDGKPTPVPAWMPLDDNDRALADYSAEVMALSKRIEQQVDARNAAMAIAAGG